MHICTHLEMVAGEELSTKHWNEHQSNNADEDSDGLQFNSIQFKQVYFPETKETNMTGQYTDQSCAGGGPHLSLSRLRLVEA